MALGHGAPPDSEGKGASRKGPFWAWLTLLAEVCAPLMLTLVLVLAMEALLGSDDVDTVIDRNLPGYSGISGRVHVEKQMWRLEHLARAGGPRIAVVGSSSVVNGVDPALLSRRMGGVLPVHNLGMTGMLAYELLFLESRLLTPETRTVIYLYNGFSFANGFHPDAVDVRWDLAWALRLRKPDLGDPHEWLTYADRWASQHLRVLRFKNLLRELAGRWLSGTLAPEPYPWDYDPAVRPSQELRPRLQAVPQPCDSWLRRAFLDSAGGGETMGYLALRLFCEQARVRGVHVILAPVPEPVFALWGGWSQGIDRAVVDERVRVIAEYAGAEFLPRELFSDIEAADGLFLDEMHLGAEGRELYTGRLAGLVGKADLQ